MPGKGTANNNNSISKFERFLPVFEWMHTRDKDEIIIYESNLCFLFVYAAKSAD